MKTPFEEFRAGDHSTASTLAALVLVALVSAACVLWFMTVALRNERLAVQGRLTDVYLTHVVSLQHQMTGFWKRRQEALESAGKGPPGETFAAVVRSNLADSVVLYDRLGKVIYPSSAGLETPTEETGDWAPARELEFQQTNYVAAAAAYGRIAEASQDLHAKARARQSQAGCLLKAGRKEAALGCLAELAGDSRLRQAMSAQGTLIVPNAQLLILKLLTSPEPGASGAAPASSTDTPTHGERARKADGRNPELGPDQAQVTSAPAAAGWSPRSTGLSALRRQTFDDLVKRLNDYADAGLSSSQRRFLMEELQASAPSAAVFPTLAAEELAAEYLEHDAALPTELKLQRAPLAKVWRLAAADRSVVALFREGRLKAELAALADSLALPDLRVTLLPPGETFVASKPVAPQEASELLPGWRLAFSFKKRDSFATLSARQTRFYLWTGFLVVLVIGLVASLVARYVAAQMRLARLKDELVSAVSHELRTPLASIRALVDTLSAGRYRDAQQLDDYLHLITKENQRLSHLIENFLTFSRLERGKHRFRFEELAPEDIVREAVASLQDRLESPQCHLETQVGPNLPHIRGDADALSTVLINLLDNACKYTDHEKHIYVRAYADRRQVCFEVEDNGIGLSRNEAKRVFDRFYQVDQTLSRRRGGCGLGLSIVQSIVRVHGGQIAVQSEPGQGSVFRVKIPCAG